MKSNHNLSFPGYACSTAQETLQVSYKYYCCCRCLGYSRPSWRRARVELPENYIRKINAQFRRVASLISVQSEREWEMNILWFGENEGNCERTKKKWNDEKRWCYQSGYGWKEWEKIERIVMNCLESKINLSALLRFPLVFELPVWLSVTAKVSLDEILEWFD